MIDTNYPSTHPLLTRRAAVVPRGLPRATLMVVDHAQGALLSTPEGRTIIDLAGGIGVMSAGHCHPDVVRAVTEQVARLQHICIHLATYEGYVALCERLATLLPHGDATKVLLVNSGAEAVENAVKIARQATQRPAVLCYTGAFHGRTLLGMTLTAKDAYKKGCGPFAPDVHRIPFPDRFHLGDGLEEDAFVARELDRLRTFLAHEVPAEQLAAIVIEPVQGEGGFLPAPRAYLQGLREICDAHGILLIFDEVQTGFCRTGAWGAYQRLGVQPDLSTWAKAMGGGMPIGAVIGKAHLMDAALPGTIGGTYGGNPVACASALATLKIMEDSDLCARAEVLGAHLRARFEVLRARLPHVADVRGLGAMIAIELCQDGDPARPMGDELQAALQDCHELGVLVIAAGVDGNVVRFLCPLNIPIETLDVALDVIIHAIEQRCT